MKERFEKLKKTLTDFYKDIVGDPSKAAIALYFLGFLSGLVLSELL